MGPFLQYTTEKPAEPIELRIYTGADAHFTLYEDENDNYNYEKGIYATIDFDWNDEEKTLTISDIQGEFPGMLKDRTFNVVMVDKDKGTGVEISESFQDIIKYNGRKIKVNL
jgi:alpha-D-xyloside xylohydrolase